MNFSSFISRYPTQLEQKCEECDKNATIARNEYLLTLAAANVHQKRYYEVDMPECMRVCLYAVFIWNQSVPMCVDHSMIHLDTRWRHIYQTTRLLEQPEPVRVGGMRNHTRSIHAIVAALNDGRNLMSKSC